MENTELNEKIETLGFLETAILSVHLNYLKGTTEDETLRIKGGV
ncbi:MAG: hypothetical protein ABFD82_11065 [Syntrophaceae bacterium]